MHHHRRTENDFGLEGFLFSTRHDRLGHNQRFIIMLSFPKEGPEVLPSKCFPKKKGRFDPLAEFFDKMKTFTP
jgi:hypothetical protein